MDGISVAASILGLVGAAAKATQHLNALVTSAKTAPQLAQSVLLEVSDVSVCLSQLQRLLFGMEPGAKSQERLIVIEQFVVVLSNCVSIFSELEEILESLDLMSGTPITKINIARWLRRQHSISTLLMRLQASKQSLTLVVTTLNCTSVGEAENAVSELKVLITQVLESNQVLAERMANLELQHSAHAFNEAPDSTQDVEHYHGKSETTLRQRELLFGNCETSTDSSIRAPNDKGEYQDNESIVTVRRMGPATSQTLTAVDGFAFEQDLFASRPYARALNRRPCRSATSSVVPTMGWSYLSGLSLADVSEVSILGLPLSPLELWNGHRYVTARDDFQEDSAGDRRQQRQASVVRTRSMTTVKYLAAPSWQFGKFFDQWDSFPEMRETDRQIVSSRNVLLLGVPSSGKRTIYRQLQLFHGHSISEHEREQARISIIRDIIDASMVAWKQVQLSAIGARALRDVEGAHARLLSFKHKWDSYDSTLYNALVVLWAHDSLRHEIQNGKGLALNQNITWYFEHLEPLFLNPRLLSDDFVLRQNRRAFWWYNQCQSVDLDGISCELFDARKNHSLPDHWLDRFDSTDALIFVVPLTAYCQDELQLVSELNMLKQQIRFFDSLTRLEIFKDVPIILFLNKTDMLERLITMRPISDYFEEYTAGANCFHACQFFADKFAKSDHRAVGDLRIYGTCAVEKSSFRGTLEDLQILPPRYNGTEPSNRLGVEASIHNPVAKSSVDKMLRKHNEESFSQRQYRPKSLRDTTPLVSLSTSPRPK